MQKQQDIKAFECIACGSLGLEFYPSEFTEFITSYVFNETGRKQNQTAFCKQCKTTFSEIRFSEAEAQKLYKGYRGDAYTAERKRFEPHYEHYDSRYKHLIKVEGLFRRYIKTIQDVVDIGSDSDINTLFRDKNITLAPYGKPFPLSDIDKTFFQLSHVLEHVSEPLEILKDLRSKVKHLYIEIPLEKHIRENLDPSLKVHWHEHINFFTLDGIRILMNRAGFKIKNLTVFSCDIGTSFNRVICLLASPVEDEAPCDMNPLEGVY